MKFNWFFRRLESLDDIPSPSDDALRQMSKTCREAGADRKRRLFDLLDETYKFSPPNWLVEREFRKIWRVVKNNRAAGITDAGDIGKSDVQLKNEYRAIAERRVRLGLIIAVIAKRNGTTGAGYPREHRAPMVENEVVDFIFSLSE